MVRVSDRVFLFLRKVFHNLQKVLVKQEIVEALGHKTELKNAKDASCTEAGYTGDLVCSVCGEVVEKGAEISALGHVWDDGVVTTKPTGTADGVKTYTCTVCDETKTEVIPATGVCDGGASCPSRSFSDVKAHWGHLGIDYCVENRLMNGVSDTEFDPDGTLTRHARHRPLAASRRAEGHAGLRVPRSGLAQ